MTGEIENPYCRFNREEVIAEIIEILEHRDGERIIVLIGNPGSGKTSTLKHIKKSPGILKKNYIPIYLDSQKYKGLDIDDLLFSVQKDIVEELTNWGKAMEKREYFRGLHSRNKPGELNTFLLAIYSVIDSLDSRLLLILDEFDSLVETIDEQTISRVMEKFQMIGKLRSKYVLILAATKKLHHIIAATPFNKLLKTAHQIIIEDVLPEEHIRRLIIEPVGDRLSYSEDALAEIIWLSGKNQYLQQLICCNLVDYLNETKKNHCSKEDVEQTIRRVLSDDRPEFEYAWHNILSTENRLIASALADENITCEKDKFFVLKKNNLLDILFEEELSKEMQVLQDFGYINRVKARRFPGYPFKIVLYGKWIRERHPFFKTVVGHLNFIAKKVDLEKLLKIIHAIPGVDLAASGFDRDIIMEAGSKWIELKNSILETGTIETKKRFENFFKPLSRHLKLDITGSSQTHENFFTIDIKNLGIGIIDEAFCFIQDGPGLSQHDLNNIEIIAGRLAQDADASTKLTLFFHFQPSPQIDNLVKKLYLNLIAIEENDLKTIIMSARPGQALKKIILSRLSLAKVSPYHAEGMATATFYGRSAVIEQLLRIANRSYAIVGARKIGKSSLLFKITGNPPPNTTYVYMDLLVHFIDAKNYRRFLKGFQAKIENVFHKKADFGVFPFGRELTRLPKIIKKISRPGERVVFIFDEADGLLAFDKKHNYKLIRIFREMSQENHCQFIFAGFKELYHQKRDIANPLYNFCEEIRLGPLEPEAALDLVTIPMESIGVHYQNPGDRELILENTGCHPSLLQFFCKHMIFRIEKHNKVADRRTILKEDIHAFLDNKFEEFIVDDLYMFSFDLSAAERLILILLAALYPGKKIFSTDEIKDLLNNQGIRISRTGIHRCLKNLVMRFILKDEGKENYQFALAVFPDILKKRYGDDFKAGTIREIKENESESL